jgi:hypothetical protein
VFVSVPFGLEFTPLGFGSFGNRLMVNDTFGGSIVALAEDGTARIFTTVPLALGHTGLRQMLMMPDNYFLDSLGIPGQLLLLPVPGSIQGGELLASYLRSIPRERSRDI